MIQGVEQPTANTPSFSIWFVVWFAGMILLAVFFTVSYLRCKVEFRTALPVSISYVEWRVKKHPLIRRISIRQSDSISTPLTYGIIHPVILMPKQTDWKNTEQLQYIFSHEYVHIYRFDAMTKLIAAYALCVHWFNPFVWVMYILFNRDIALSCDESVIRQFGDKSKSAYSLMLIRMEAKKRGLSPLYNHFGKNAIEERITAIMNTKRTTKITLLSACLTVLVTVSLFATSAIASTDSKTDDTLAINYEDGAPYIHDILTNNTDSNIIETQYGMLAYDEYGSPLKLYWNFLDSSTESSFENVVRTKTNILSNQTEEYRGANHVAYSLLCLKQVLFEDGTVWNNPDYENWFETYAGKETDVDELQNYYPHEYKIE